MAYQRKIIGFVESLRTSYREIFKFPENDSSR